MAQLPLRDEDCHYQEWKAALWPKLLDELGINPGRFDALLNRVAAERSLALTPHRGEIIEACYHFYMLSLPSEGAEQTRKAIRQVEKLLERDDQLAALQRLRARWTDEAVENAYFAGLWYELECDLERYGIIFIKPLGKFYVSMFRKVPDTRLCIRTACLECTAWWNSRESLRRARPTQEPLRDWIMHLAVVFEEAGGKLAQSWASWRSDLSRDYSPFVAFLTPLNSMLPSLCRKSDAALGEYVKRTGQAVRDGNLTKARPYYSPIGRLVLPREPNDFF